MSGFPFLKSFRGLRIRKSEGELEFQDVFLDKIVLDREFQVDEYVEQALDIPVSKWLVWVLYAFFVLMVAVFFARTFYMQAFAGEEFSLRAEENTIRSIPAFTERGVIYDSNGKQLVFNRSSFDFVCDKRDVPEVRIKKEQLLRDIADVLQVRFEDLKTEFDKTAKPRFLAAENVSHAQLIRLEARNGEFLGCEIEENTIREYVADADLAHVLGYTAKVSASELKEFPEYGITEQIGKVGIEKAYEKNLRGIPGKTLFEKDALGNIVKERGEISSNPGESLTLWLDFELQQKVGEALGNTFERIGAEKAVGVALDPRTGGVLALVSIPSFNNNLFSGGITQEQYQGIIEDPRNPLFNRAIAGTYPAGSTIKPLVASAALQEHIIDPDKEILTHGFIEVANEYDPEIVYRFNDNANHGWVDMRDAIAVSSNVYFYTIGGGFEDQKGLGPTRLKKYLNEFGWGSATGIDLPGEVAGLVPDPAWKKEAKGEGWWDGDTYLFSIGQGNVLATPLQVASSFVPIANGGILYKPQMVKEIMGDEIKKVPPEIMRVSTIDKENLEVVRDGMRQSVTWGSSVMLNQLPVSVGTKTGTAQTGRKDAEGKDFLYSWVTVFAPYENPEIVLTVMVEEAKEGSLAVLPVAKEVLEWYFTR
jgi:penicillin-binding protein 2